MAEALVIGGHGGGGGGSSYISGYNGCIAITSETEIVPKVTTSTKIEDSYHYSGYIFTETNMIAGNATMPNYNGGAMTGNLGNGYAIITNMN